MQRYGITVPFDGVPLAGQRELFAELPDLGYTDVWSSEVDGADAFTPLVLASVWAPALRLGTAIAPVFTRGPATLAQCAASLAAAAPGRVAIGIGSSSDVIVERWNGAEFDRPLQRVRDTARFLRAALAGDKVTERYETFAVDGFRLGLVPEQPPKLLVAALRPQMLRLAGREGDGAILNWLGPGDVGTVIPYVHAAGPGREIAARIFVAAIADPDQARAIGRRAPPPTERAVYRAFHDGGPGRPPARVGGLGGRRPPGRARAIGDESWSTTWSSTAPRSLPREVRQYAEPGSTPILCLLPTGGDLARRSGPGPAALTRDRRPRLQGGEPQFDRDDRPVTYAPARMARYSAAPPCRPVPDPPQRRRAAIWSQKRQQSSAIILDSKAPGRSRHGDPRRPQLPGRTRVRCAARPAGE